MTENKYTVPRIPTYTWPTGLAAGVYYFVITSDQKSLLYFKGQLAVKPAPPGPKPLPLEEN